MITLIMQWTKMDANEIYLMTLLRKNSRHCQMLVHCRFQSVPAGMMVSSSDKVLYQKSSGTEQKYTLFNSEEMEKEQLLRTTDGYKHKNIYQADENRLFFSLPPKKTLSLKGDHCNGG